MAAEALEAARREAGADMAAAQDGVDLVLEDDVRR